MMFSGSASEAGTESTAARASRDPSALGFKDKMRLFSMTTATPPPPRRKTLSSASLLLQSENSIDTPEKVTMPLTSRRAELGSWWRRQVSQPAPAVSAPDRGCSSEQLFGSGPFGFRFPRPLSSRYCQPCYRSLEEELIGEFGPLPMDDVSASGRPQEGSSSICEQAMPLVDLVLQGHSAAIFCHGTTVAGEPLTIMGRACSHSSSRGQCTWLGLAGLAAERLFSKMTERCRLGEGFRTYVSLLDVHMEEKEGNTREHVVDLLADGCGGKVKEVKPLELMDDPSCPDGFRCDGLRVVAVQSLEKLQELLHEGRRRRFMEKRMNKKQPKSLCMLSITIEGLKDGVAQRRSRLMLADFAGLPTSGKASCGANGSSVLTLLDAAIGNVRGDCSSVESHSQPGSTLTVLMRDCLSRDDSRAVMVLGAGTGKEEAEKWNATFNAAMLPESLSEQATLAADQSTASPFSEANISSRGTTPGSSSEDLNDMLQGMAAMVRKTSASVQEQRVEALATQSYNLQEQRRAAVQARELAAAEAVQIKIRLAALEEEIGASQPAIASLVQENATARKEKEKMQQDSASLCEQIAEAELNAHRSRIHVEMQSAEIERCTAERASQLQNLDKQREEWRTKKAQMEGIIDASRRGIEELRQREKLQQDESWKTHQETVDRLQPRLAELQESANKESSMLAHWQTLAEQANADLERQQKSVIKARRDILKERRGYQEAINDYKTRAAELTQMRTDLVVAFLEAEAYESASKIEEPLVAYKRIVEEPLAFKGIIEEPVMSKVAAA